MGYTACCRIGLEWTCYADCGGADLWLGLSVHSGDDVHGSPAWYCTVLRSGLPTEEGCARGSPSPAWRSSTPQHRSKWRFTSLRNGLRPPFTPPPRRDRRPGRGGDREIGRAFWLGTIWRPHVLRRGEQPARQPLVYTPRPPRLTAGDAYQARPPAAARARRAILVVL
jgi:hypothetical protein